MLSFMTRDSYAAAGVDIAAGNDAVARYRTLMQTWKHPQQLEEIGGFGGLFRLPGNDRQALAASTDGVGTKVLVAAELHRYDTIGADLVNHCVNDILVVNATPLFFLDYFAAGKLDPQIAAEVVRGCFEACRAHNCALLGGETAEMPDLYAAGHFDLAGTIVGLSELSELPLKEDVHPGDAILGLPSFGLHTNGYTLARKLLDVQTFGDALLAPHPSYYEDVRKIQGVAKVKAMAHITGGGLLENLPRTLPENVKAVCEQSRWPVPEIFAELCRRGDLTHAERYRTFNMGIGYTLVTSLADAANAMAAVPAAKVIGWIESRQQNEPRAIVHPARTE